MMTDNNRLRRCHILSVGVPSVIIVRYDGYRGALPEKDILLRCGRARQNAGGMA